MSSSSAAVPTNDDDTHGDNHDDLHNDLFYFFTRRSWDNIEHTKYFFFIPYISLGIIKRFKQYHFVLIFHISLV